MSAALGQKRAASLALVLLAGIKMALARQQSSEKS